MLSSSEKALRFSGEPFRCLNNYTHVLFQHMEFSGVDTDSTALSPAHDSYWVTGRQSPPISQRTWKSFSYKTFAPGYRHADGSYGVLDKRRL